MKPKICSSPEECRGLFRRSLFIVGEFGGNDYNSPLFAFRPLEEVHEFVGDVVNSIGEGIERRGPWTWWCPGCSRSAASRCTCPSSGSSRRCTAARAGASRTSTRCRGCTTWRCSARSWSSGRSTPTCASCTPTTTRPPSSSSSTPRNGVSLRQKPRACCGAPGVGVYNFNLTSKCGEPGAYACDDPSNHWSWDGIHLTEASYGHIARGWLYGPFADPPIVGNRNLE
ncbi:unnamed protein product [Triticum turgidum subsp. durum]|uniref:GDSL esterase/lipase n=1 Tax=Triticum turgidum subsp. durum TaxID=4567 RepID=A0A9R1QDD0_TRITD|nr:unnamed protein product [Triticum turgidum subsp. durum]